VVVSPGGFASPDTSFPLLMSLFLLCIAAICVEIAAAVT
jgi:hypothetical protein